MGILFRHQKLPGREEGILFRHRELPGREEGILFHHRNFQGGTPLWLLEFNQLFCFRSGGVILTTLRMNLPDGGHTSTSRCKGTAKGGTHLLVAAGFLLRSSSNVAAI